jgi:hypothetical protein
MEKSLSPRHNVKFENIVSERKVSDASFSSFKELRNSEHAEEKINNTNLKRISGTSSEDPLMKELGEAFDHEN